MIERGHLSRGHCTMQIPKGTRGFRYSLIVLTRESVRVIVGEVLCDMAKGESYVPETCLPVLVGRMVRGMLPQHTGLWDPRDENASGLLGFSLTTSVESQAANLATLQPHNPTTPLFMQESHDTLFGQPASTLILLPSYRSPLQN